MNLKQRASALSQSKKQMLALTCLVFVLLLGIIYWWYDARFVSTDDAYLNANVVQITPQISGAVASLAIVNNQYVKTGQVLFTIDPAPYQLVEDKATAQLTMAVQTVAENRAAVNASAANVAVAEVNLQHAKVSAKRIITLVNQHVLPAQNGDDAVANLDSATADLALAKAQLQQVQLSLAASITAVSVAKATLAQAALNLQYTKIVAPVSGQIANLSLRVGDVVPAEQAQFSLIANNQYWLDANFEETDLSQIKLGQQADVEIDIYSGQHFKGVVESIGGGSGQAFSLLPPQNATGNWVKVTQRVPVRVMILDLNPRQILPIGTSASVRINTHQAVIPDQHNVLS